MSLMRLAKKTHNKIAASQHHLTADHDMDPAPWRLVVPGLADAQKVNHENQGLATFDHAACTVFAIAQMWWNGDASTATNLHSSNTLIPASNNLTLAEPETEGIVAIPRSVELFTVAPGNTHIVNFYLLTGFGFGTVANIEVFQHQLIGRVIGRIDFNNRFLEIRHSCTLPSREHQSRQWRAQSSGAKPTSHPQRHAHGFRS